MMLKQVVVAAGIVAAGIGSAEATQIGRVGMESCGAWMQTRQMKTPIKMLMEQWITGWLDRANFNLDPDILEGEDWLGVMARIDKYCAAHPLDKLYNAVGGVEQELMGRHPALSKSNSEEKR
jgi:hypothetical protein